MNESSTATEYGVDCPLCQSKSASYWAEENRYNVVRCTSCRLLYVSPMPDSSIVKEAVVTGLQRLGSTVLNVRSRRSPKKIRYYRQVFREVFLDHLTSRSERKLWLDIGAGYGESMQAVQTIGIDGIEVIGVEPMTHKADVARSLGLNIHNGFLLPNQFQADVVSIIDIFSHIPNFDGFLRTVSTNIKKSGRLFIETGNLADLDDRSDFPNELGLPDHLVFAGEIQMQRYLERAGFEVINVRRIRFDGFVNFIKNAVKLFLGKSTKLGIPYSSRYRQLQIIARVRNVQARYSE